MFRRLRGNRSVVLSLVSSVRGYHSLIRIHRDNMREIPEIRSIQRPRARINRHAVLCPQFNEPMGSPLLYRVHELTF